MPNPTKVSEEDFFMAQECMIGWCNDCKEFNREMTEPDAEFYDCDVCDENNVYGAENALIMGLIVLVP